jgi:hypothetical protein
MRSSVGQSRWVSDPRRSATGRSRSVGDRRRWAEGKSCLSVGPSRAGTGYTAAATVRVSAFCNWLATGQRASLLLCGEPNQLAAEAFLPPPIAHILDNFVPQNLEAALCAAEKASVSTPMRRFVSLCASSETMRPPRFKLLLTTLRMQLQPGHTHRRHRNRTSLGPPGRSTA